MVLLVKIPWLIEEVILGLVVPQIEVAPSFPGPNRVNEIVPDGGNYDADEQRHQIVQVDYSGK